MRRKIYIFIILLLSIIFTNINTYAKYTFDNICTAVTIDIDRKCPEIKLIEINNSNTGYEKYANKTHIITIKIEVIEKNIIKNNFNKENIKILVNDRETNPEVYEIKELSNNQDKIIYEIKLKGLYGDGLLKMKINKGVIIDKSNNFNLENIINTEIGIDNTLPIAKFIETRKYKGKVKTIITTNETVRKNDGWNISEDSKTLKKEFKSNDLNFFEIVDFANNKGKVEINTNL